MSPVSPYQVCVVFLTRVGDDGEPEVLLGRKKTGLGSGNVVGLGGKIEAGETAVEAAVREVFEESSLVVEAADLTEMGLVKFAFPYRENWSQDSTVFVGTRWRGEPQESDEVNPAWYRIDALPLGDMWDDAKYWLPAVLAGERVLGDFTFGEDCATVSWHELHDPAYHPEFGVAHDAGHDPRVHTPET
ncbi:8-oxo-dGTP diphosphatase [Herbiconiux moechotypicola]|uniref:8-oxo-dGTP diphosphatase n=1 Tax=Herbiconiux moechotypicola TaxID=637393 RepID=UPI00217D9F71|nr:8-oxo-dGTP diphosphatase [Herbiconiux moechotypicola]MCS5731596.1 8-oxo-dGTP diphosphatase [Herbiconiux moechotypicola]